MSNLIKRTYRITPEQDKLVKKAAKKLSTKDNKVSESAYIRLLIEGGRK